MDQAVGPLAFYAWRIVTLAVAGALLMQCATAPPCHPR
jgi:hypothetical protein